MDPLTLLFSTEHDSQGLILGQGMMSFDIVTGFQELLNLPHSSSQELPEGFVRRRNNGTMGLRRHFFTGRAVACTTGKHGPWIWTRSNQSRIVSDLRVEGGAQEGGRQRKLRLGPERGC